MTKVYFSFPIMGQDSGPDWVEKVIKNQASKAFGFTFYNPWEKVLEQATLRPDWLLSEPNSRAAKYAEAYKLDPMLFEPISNPQVLSRLNHGDSGPNLDVPFKDLYVLLRSDVMVTDLCSPSYGGTSQEVTFAYLWNIPVIGITDRFVNSPWMMNKVKAVSSPKTSDDIVQLIFAYSPIQQQIISSLSPKPLPKEEVK